ncbi:thioredoxin family protein [Thiocystis violacea]|uniref:thioredoxin family protein n=1 Tax=Thiocystis violacea TaxID=13725 RepID=UPI001904157F|nr:thioredoxin family protein [Thiocystis violacea]MBK1716802.1 thioredoxin [Thiocystis violacea]
MPEGRSLPGRTRREAISLVAILAIILFWSGSLLADTLDSARFFNATFGDFSEELKNAKSEGKQGVLLMFEMDECPFCHRMKGTVLNRPEVQDYFKANFLIFPVDVEGDVEITDFAGSSTTQKDFALKSHRVRATPVFAFFDLDGNLVTKYIGATRDADEFMLLGRYVVEGHYKNAPFQQFKREHRKVAGQ